MDEVETVAGGRRERRWSAVLVAVVVAAVAAVAVWWWLLRPRDVAVEAAPLVTPVLYGERITRLVDPAVGLDVPDRAERECVLAKVSGDTALVEALGERPRESPRFGEVERLHAQCTSVTPVKEALARHGAAEPNEVQLRCIADALAAYPDGERQQVLAGEVVNVPPGALRDKVRELLAVCGLDSAIVTRD